MNRNAPAASSSCSRRRPARCWQPASGCTPPGGAVGGCACSPAPSSTAPSRRLDGKLPRGWRVSSRAPRSSASTPPRTPARRSVKIVVRRRRRRLVVRHRAGQAVREVPAERLDQDRERRGGDRPRRAVQPARPRRDGDEGADRDAGLDARGGRLRFGGERRRPGELPARRMGALEGHGVVRRHRSWRSCPRGRCSRRSPFASGATRAPMSKYIYGQFIEHLGRCIYGGIWAEMLEDRKFFYGVGDKESPWKPVGDAGGARDEHGGAVRRRAHAGRRARRGRQAGRHPAGRPRRHGRARSTSAASSSRATRALGPVQVSLVWGTGEKDRQTVTIALGVTRRSDPFPIAFTAGATTDAARLEIIATGRGVLRIGTASLMPADNVEGFRADTLRLLRELNAPVYRWPGGNFVSGYDWRDGIGDRDRRPPRKNPAWKGVEHNDVGIDEFMALCRLLGDRALHRREQRPRRRAVGGRRGGVRQRRGDDAAWESCARRTAARSRTRAASGRSATRCTATGSSATCRSRSTRRSTTSSPGRCARRTRRSRWSASATWARGPRGC